MPERQRWEYRLILVAHADVASEETQARLNALGAEGWDLFAAHPHPLLGLVPHYPGASLSRVSAINDMLYVLKREVRA